ncbi:MAG: response regulator transcription factor [Burkholderiales bacterium]|nr:response regulator transcription factor [Burkholderiales bacterium]
MSDRQLPLPFAEHLGRSSGDRYVGRRIVVTVRPVRDLLLLNARQKMPVDELSERELAVARYIAQGSRYREIARRLGLSPATVRNYTQAIHQRLGVRTNTELSLQLQTTDDLRLALGEH